MEQSGTSPDSTATSNDGLPVLAARKPEGAASSRFYDKIRKSIESRISREGEAPGRMGELLLLIPDVFTLLWRLVSDPRVSGKNKVLLGSGIAYFILPIDLLPEQFLGAIGYLDDLVFAVYILNKMLQDTDEQVLREHWSGSGDILDTIRNVLHSADGLVTREVVDRVKGMMK